MNGITTERRGYIFNFQGHGAFDPNGKVGSSMTDEEIKAHNEQVERDEIELLKATGRGVLYLTTAPMENGGTYYKASTWTGGLKIDPYRVRSSWHNFAGRDGRTDVDFNFDGSRWHGVNIGDNQILRVKRCKS